MKQYFQNHPIITYRGQQLRNIMLNAQLTKEVLGDTTTFLPYTIQEGETPTTIAFDYYGSIDYTWLVLFSNQITDPFTSWPKTQEQFHDFLIKTYGSVEITQSTIQHYLPPEDSTDTNPPPPATPTTYQYMTPDERAGYTPVYQYDYEHALNEQKRQIKLVDKVYAARVALELEKKLKS